MDDTELADGRIIVGDPVEVNGETHSPWPWLENTGAWPPERCGICGQETDGWVYVIIFDGESRAAQWLEQVTYGDDGRLNEQRGRYYHLCPQCNDRLFDSHPEYQTPE